MGFSAKILLDSVDIFGNRLTTFQVNYPRIIMAEVNTHRAFSRNSASSRAIPISKMIERAVLDPYIPIHWGKNQSGMQAFAEVSDKLGCEKQWLIARDNTIKSVQELVNFGVHKQVANRLLEPFLFVTTIISSTTYRNFFKLRTHRDAQPEIQKLANLMKFEYDNSIPTEVPLYGWHRPLTNDLDKDLEGDILNKVSVARCARVSYLTHDGKRDISADLNLYDKLVSREDESEPKHLSPTEMVAQSIDNEMHGNFKGWKQLRKFIRNESGI